MTPQSCDIEAVISFISTQAGGRKMPAFSGYRPQFYYGGHDWDAIHQYEGRELVLPGETATAYLTFLSPEYHVGQIFVKKAFQVREGARTIAYGHVTKIVNLIESAKRMAQEQSKRYFKRYWKES